MPVEELLFSGDTTEQGRVIINSAYTRTCLWTGRTEDTTFFDGTKNIIPANTSSNNKIDEVGTPGGAGSAQFVDFSSILGGQNNTIRKNGLLAGFVRNSSIIGGENNLIQTNGNPPSESLLNSVIVGGNNNEIIQPSNDDLENVAILAMDSKTVATETTNTTFAKNLYSTGGRIKKVRELVIVNSDWVTSGVATHQIEPDDDIIFIKNGSNTIFPSGDWCLGLDKMSSSEDGRVVEIFVKNTAFSMAIKSVRLGNGTSAGGDGYVNHAIKSTPGVYASICPTDYQSVKIFKRTSGIDVYFSIGGNGI